MTATHTLRVRRSLLELQREYETGNKKPLEDLMRAWKGIKELPADDPYSFFTLGGYHGEPFRGAGWGNATYWGGYCNHGNVLFPTWHRVYLIKIEEALRRIPGCEDVALPFWDETCEESLAAGIPWALTVENFILDGVSIGNPLRSFVFNKNIVDHINGDEPNYSKMAAYETVRYPLSGLVGSPADREATLKHNKKFPNYAENVAHLNRNVVNWLTATIRIGDKDISSSNLHQLYKECLDAPNFTVFSNTTSAAQWNGDVAGGAGTFVPLEKPHNGMHLAVGGFDYPTGPNAGHVSPITGANGDMGENDTAALDPIFYFHHCFVDRVFWLWQTKHGYTDHLDIIPEYPGTNSVDSQGPTPGIVPNSWLTLESPLNPFKMATNGRAYTSLDCINIEKQLGYTYGEGSLQKREVQAAGDSEAGRTTLYVAGINRAPIRGSFLISAFATIDGQRYHVGSEAVLSRWSVKYCANCQTHLEVKAFFKLDALHEASRDSAVYDVEVRTRDGVILGHQALAGGTAGAVRKAFHLELR